MSKLRSLKHIARMEYGDALAQEVRLDGNVPVFGSNGVTGFHNKANTRAPAIVIGRKGSFGKVTWTDVPGFCIDTAYYIDTRHTAANLRWLYWALQSLGLDVHSEDTGVPGLSREKAYKSKLLLPTPTEQQDIANFLDEQTARIDALIAEKERLAIAVLEYEQAQISQLLAQGLSDTALTETGNLYVPAAPSHWRVVPFKRALRGMEQGWSPQCDSRPAVGSEWGVLKVGCVNGTRFNPAENKALPEALAPDLSCVIRKGDVLVSRANTRELVGSAALVWGDFPNLLLCDKLYRLKLASDWVTPEFAVLLMRSDTARRQIELGASGASSSMQNISQDVIRELVVALPPLDEQSHIVEAANAIRAKADDLASHVDEHLDRLREYRASLISAAVTGQLDINSYKEAA